MYLECLFLHTFNVRWKLYIYTDAHEELKKSAEFYMNFVFNMED